MAFPSTHRPDVPSSAARVDEAGCVRALSWPILLALPPDVMHWLGQTQTLLPGVNLPSRTRLLQFLRTMAGLPLVLQPWLPVCAEGERGAVCPWHGT